MPSKTDKAFISINVHIYPTPITHETRMLKETKSIADAQLVDKVYLVGLWKDGLEEYEQIDARRQIWRVRPLIGNQKSGLFIKTLRYVEWQLRILWHFRTSSVKYVNCHSLPVLPIGVLFKLFFRAALVYDTHELETETSEAIGIKRVLYKLVEKSFIRFADAVITVNGSIMDWYKNEYGLRNVAAVRNIPYQRQEEEISKSNILKTRFCINDDEILFIFQGALGIGRGIDILLDTFSKVDSKKHILFMGFGEWEARIKQYEKAYSNIHFIDAVRPSEVNRYTAGADVGLCLQENMGLNHYLSLPNKLFEYIMNAVPVIVSDFPELRRVIDEADCGWKVAVDKSAFYSLVTSISKDEIAVKRNKAAQYRKMIGWQNEEKAILDVYRNILVCKKGVVSREN
jgi:glycosyltransferase involved in cell wall biosynthesis